MIHRGAVTAAPADSAKQEQGMELGFDVGDADSALKAELVWGGFALAHSKREARLGKSKFRPSKEIEQVARLS